MRTCMLMVLAIVLSAAPALADRDVSDSYVQTVSPCQVCPNSTFEFTFYVHNGLEDAEWIRIVEIDFPKGFEVIEGTDHYEPLNAPIGSWDFNFLTAGPATAWVDADEGAGEIAGGQDGLFTVTANTAWHYTLYDSSYADVSASFLTVGTGEVYVDMPAGNADTYYLAINAPVMNSPFPTTTYTYVANIAAPAANIVPEMTTPVINPAEIYDTLEANVTLGVDATDPDAGTVTNVNVTCDLWPGGQI